MRHDLLGHSALFLRRISRAVAGEEHHTVWSGWQAIEEYGDDGLEARRVFGLGLDEIVRAEVDLDDDGAVETTQRPIYDRIGNWSCPDSVDG